MDETQNPEQEKTTEERFKETVEKLRPYIKNLWQARRKLLWINGGVAAATILILLFLVKPYYDTTVTILPDYGTNVSSLLSQFSGLASLAGVNVGQSNPTQIYQQLITSEAVLSPVIYAKYKTEEFSDSVNLIQYDEINPDESLPLPLQKRKMFLKELKKLTKDRISTDVDRMTQILTVTVQMPEGQLSADVVNNIASSLDSYIQTQIRTSAKDQRIYVDKRMKEVKDSLTIAENNLKDFNEMNKLISQSPALTLKQSRLQRRIDILNTVYLQLAQQSELAKIQEVKDTPVINIEEAAKNPVIRTGPRRTLIVIIVMFFSVLLSGGYMMFSRKLKFYYKTLLEKKPN
jgi:uncharacterized protein involved in exopolysaccharide biosynthesis